VGITRRDLLSLLFAARLRAEPSPSPLAALRSRASLPPGERRCYRADAQVQLLGLTVFSRAGVGAGFASVQTGPEASLLRFGAGSDPGRAKGLNRLGYIEELRAGDEAAYFGFMTASPEQSVAQARQALAQGTGDAHHFAVAEGWLGPRTAKGSLVRFSFPPQTSWKDAPALLRRIREDCRRSPAEVREVPSGPAVHPFLHAVRESLAAAARKMQVEYVYNARRYRLRVEKDPDPGMGRRLAARRLCADPERLLRLNGEIRRDGSPDVTRFSFWAEPERSLLPVRIELQARSYLKLVFEHDPSLPPAELEQT
jgi:hypothetical protein